MVIAGFGGDLDVQTITDFVDSGRSVVLAASSDLSETVRAIASEFGVDLDDKGTKVFDHFSFATKGDAADHTLIAATDAVDSVPIVGGPLKVRVQAHQQHGSRQPCSLPCV